MRRLYIIGNGFDLHYDLPTRTDNFIAELKKIPFEYFESAWDAYVNYGVDWHDFEESLAEIDLATIEEEIIEGPDYLSDHEYDRDSVIWNVEEHTRMLLEAREIALRNMISNAEEELKRINNKDKENFFNLEDAIVSFNYTSTIESLFNYSKDVLHIHGSFSDNSELVFGFGEESEEYNNYISKLNEKKNDSMLKEVDRIQADSNFSDDEKVRIIDEIKNCYDQEWNDPYIDREYEAICSFYKTQKKKYEYEKLNSFLKSARGVKEVVVLGHSMGRVDHEYFEIVENVLQPIKWIVSVFGEGKETRRLIESYSFKNKVVFDSMDNIMQK